MEFPPRAGRGSCAPARPNVQSARSQPAGEMALRWEVPGQRATVAPCRTSRERSSSRPSAGGWLTWGPVLVCGVGQSVVLGGGPSRNPYRAEDGGYAGMAELADAT